MTSAALPIPAVDGIHIGGSELLVAFLERAARRAVDRLQVLSPYVDDAVFTDGAVRRAWHQVLATAQTTVVVRTPASAEAVVRSLPRRGHAVELLVHRRLHAKVFVASRNGVYFALCGSQNLTGAALRQSEEAGVFIDSGLSDRHRDVARRLREMVEAVARASTPYADNQPGRLLRIPRPRDARPFVEDIEPAHFRRDASNVR